MLIDILQYNTDPYTILSLTDKAGVANNKITRIYI